MACASSDRGVGLTSGARPDAGPQPSEPVRSAEPLAAAFAPRGDDDAGPPLEAGPAFDASVDAAPAPCNDTPVVAVALADAGLADSGDDAGAVDAGPPAVLLATRYAADYRYYDLGPVPGVPTGHLGGSMLKPGAPNTLLLATNTESQTSKIFEVDLERGPCGHIVAFKGAAREVASTPNADANLVLLGNSVVYTRWPNNALGLLEPGDVAPRHGFNLAALGVESASSGLGVVPSSLAAAGSLRVLTWPGGKFYELPYAAQVDAGPAPASDADAAAAAPDGGGSDAAGALPGYVGAGHPPVAFQNAALRATLPHGPGGFAYVPAGSPGFAKDSIIVAEWSASSVATYEVDANGNPDASTRRPFFDRFPRPWGAYFEPTTGDFLFLTWGSLPEHVFVVQGFVPPPPPPPEPPTPPSPPTPPGPPK